jgi:UDP-N-acetyl-2-amino-2-deoxyglucuronate dehydrogenase
MYKVAIIGTGVAAKTHIQVLLNINDVKVTSVFGRDHDRLESFAKTIGISPYQSIERMIKDQQIDIVVVANQNYFHAVDTVEALNAGANVLVEKPFSISEKERIEMMECGEKNGKKIGVVLQKRYDPLLNKLRNMVLHKEFGKIAFISLIILMSRTSDYFNTKKWLADKRKSGGGVLINQAIHFIDALLWIIGEKIENINGWLRKDIRELAIEDTATASIRFMNGLSMSINATIACQKKQRNKIYIIGDEKSAFMEGRNLCIISDLGDVFFNDENNYDYNGDLYRLWDDFILSLKNNSVFCCEAQNCMEVHYLISKIYEMQI